MNSSSIFGDKCQRIKTFKGQVFTRNVRFQRFTRTEQGVTKSLSTAKKRQLFKKLSA